MTSRSSDLRRAFRAIEDLLAELPLAPEVLAARLEEAFDPRSFDARGVDVDAARDFVCRANRRAASAAEALAVRADEAPEFPSAGDILGDADLHAGTAAWLRSNLTPVEPASPIEDGLAELHDMLAEHSAERLGDGLEHVRQALSPVRAPRDADWAGSALESLGVDQEVVRSWARPSRAPGWLWARIRRDVAEARTAVRARRVPVAVAAATVVLSASLAVVLLHGSGQGEGAGPQITFLRVDRPLSDQYASATLLQRLRDGR